ncbi:MAG: polysaccharide lyase [Chthoniobacteraceae bacterium]|nr:polysaccharide lyase [Chthoniobacteraceae bacterium]
MGVDPAGGVRITDQDAGNGLGLAQWLSVTPGTKYSAKMAVTGDGSIGLVLIFTPKIPAKAAQINQIRLREVTGYFSAAKQEPIVATVPDGATFMRVFVYSTKPGKCDVVVKSIELKTVDASVPDTKGAVDGAPPPANGAAAGTAPAPAGPGALALDAAGNPAGKALQNAPDILPKGTVYTIDFETGDYSQCHLLEGGKKAIVKNPDPVRNGKYAMKVMMTHDQHRTEVTGPRSEAYGEYKYGWSLFLPETFDGETFFSIVTQWHTWGSGKDYPPDGGPPSSITIAKNQWNLKIQHQDGTEFKTAKQYIPFGSILEDKGKWTDFYMEVNWQSAKTGGGYLRLYKNGVKVVDYNGPTWFDEKTKGPFFKMGIYKGGASWRGDEAGAILYCDEFRIGDKSATREQIDPAKQPRR